MTHILSHHPDMSAVQGAPPSLPEPTPPALPVPTRKRKAKTEGDGEAGGPEPRRLRRSHEACARCRSKKIKCDSKHPKCSACTNAGTPCHQEDRHRQTLTPRGHTETLERRVAQCELLLKRHIEGFNVENIDDFMVREGLDPDIVPQALPGFPAYANPPPNGAIPHTAYGPVNGLPPYPPPPPAVYSVPPPNGAPYPVYVSHIHPAFQHQNIAPQLQQAMPPPAQHTPGSPDSSGQVLHDIKGQDPKSNDMSSTTALAKNFGVSAAIVNEIKLGPNAMDKEDLAVGALHSGRDRDITTDFKPRQPNHWLAVSMRRGSAPSISPTQVQPSSPYVWLPRDRDMVDQIVNIYFTRLNIHRPVFPRNLFKVTLDGLYAGTAIHDPGFILSVYMVLALGTLSEMNQACSRDTLDGKVQDVKHSARAARSLMPETWPEHEEFFERALAVKPDLRVTVSSLQALIFLQWYLYTERQGRSLWRLVGSMVRLAVELGLHHDPYVQRKTFTPEECDLRVRLWAIVMVHDRGTSLLLGRPLAIAPSDSNTPHPKRNCSDYSEHFAVSGLIADLQADIIVSLYGPNKRTPDAIWRQATRIIKAISECQASLPPEYHRFFSGTERWSTEDRRKLVQGINSDQGLTMLKIGIARILLLRALFSSKELSFECRSKALDDAIVTSHNIIIVHNELIRFPDIAFFVSPIPLHIAAMVILYGHMSSCKVLTRQQALEDVWMALDMLPRFRWRWERKDYNGEHPLIAKLAEKVFDAPLHQAGPTGCPMLIPELDWSADSEGSTTPESPAMPTPTPSAANPPNPPNTSNPTNAPPAYPVHQPPSYDHHRPQVKGQEGNLAEVPPHWFYPLATEHGPVPPGQHPSSAPGPSQTSASSSYAPLGTIGCAPSQESYVQEEKDAPVPPNQMEVWVNMIDQQGIGPFMHGHN